MTLLRWAWTARFTYPLPDDSSAISLATADLNGDGKPDLVVGGQDWYGDPSTGQFLAVFLGTGTGAFAAPIIRALPPDGDIYTYPSSIQVGDLNEDGRPDVVVSRSYNTLDVLPGNGDGTLGAVALVPVDPSPTVWARSVALGDVTGDGHLDVVAADSNGTTVRVLAGTGTGAFAPGVGYAVGVTPTAVRLADVNADGRLDVVTANENGNNVSVLLGRSGGTFAPVRNFATNLAPYSLALADLDGNATPDLVVTSERTQGVSTMRNDGNWSQLGAPAVQIADVAKVEGNRGTTYFTFTVSLAFSLDAPVTVNFATANGTATTANNDYVAKSGTLTFAPGETSKTIAVVVNGDNRKEANEVFYVDLSGLSANAVMGKSRGIGTILNDD